MPQSPGRPGLESEISGLTERRGQLRQAASLPGAHLQQLLEAAFAELDGAIDALTALRAQTAAESATDRLPPRPTGDGRRRAAGLRGAARPAAAGREIRCGLLGVSGPVPNVLDIGPVSLPGEPDQLIVAATRAGPA